MTAILKTISVIMIVLQTIGVFIIDLENLFRLGSGTAFFVKLILIIASAVPYITLWLVAKNYDRLTEMESTLNRVNTNTTKPREVKSFTSNSRATLTKTNVGKNWTCKKCGEPNSNTDMSCRNCGEYK